MQVEQRDNLRASLCLGVELLIGDRNYVGQTENISLSGAMVMLEVASQALEIIDSEGKIWLAFEEEFVEYQCVVIHTSRHGIGIKFLHENKASIESLRQMITDTI